MARRYGSGRITIDVCDYIGEIDDDDLLEEVKRRKLIVAAPHEAAAIEMIEEACEQLLRGRVIEARIILERLLYPKWRDSPAARRAYEEARKSAA